MTAIKDTTTLAMLTVILSATAAIAEITIADPPPENTNTGAGPGIASPPPPNESGANASFSGNDTLQFANKDKLHGSLVSIEPAGTGLRWKHPDVEKHIDFALASISQVTLGKKPVSPSQTTAASVILSNDDILIGNIVSMEGDKLILDTKYAGKINIRRSMIKKIIMGIKSKSVLYEGPSEMAEWTVSRGGPGQQAWSFKDKALISHRDYPIARNIEDMSDLVDFEFEIAWRNQYPAFSFIFFNDNLANQANCYMLQVSGSSVYMYRYDRNSGSQHLGSIDMQRFSSGQTTKARFNILADKTKKTFVLLIDGQMTKQWTDAGSFAGMGKVIMFCPQSQGPIKVSNIKVSEWDGKVPQITGSSSDAETKEDLIRFANGDKVSGKIEAIISPNAKFKTSYAGMDIPLERISEIIMASASLERARRNKEDIRAIFAERGSVTIKLTRLNKNTFSGTSENFGEINLPLDAFRLLEFNIYREKTEASTDEFAF
jgi:hypothetical protein